MIWRVQNKKNGEWWRNTLTDNEKAYWEGLPQGKALRFEVVKEIPRATAPEAVKKVTEKTEEAPKTEKKKTTRKPRKRKPKQS